MFQWWGRSVLDRDVVGLTRLCATEYSIVFLEKACKFVPGAGTLTATPRHYVNKNLKCMLIMYLITWDEHKYHPIECSRQAKCTWQENSPCSKTPTGRNPHCLPKTYKRPTSAIKSAFGWEEIIYQVFRKDRDGRKKRGIVILVKY